MTGLPERDTARIAAVNRRAFLRRVGLLTGGLAAGAAVATGVEERRLDTTITDAGHAVGADRPAGLRSTTLIYRASTTEPVVALSFDDGPSEKYTASVLDILDQKDVTATFFLIGRHVAALPDLAKRASERHEIGNHTWSHPNMGLYHAPMRTINCTGPPPRSRPPSDVRRHSSVPRTEISPVRRR